MTETPPFQMASPVMSRKILIIGDLKGSVDLSSLHPHEILRSKHLEGAFEIFTKSRPDLVIYFTHGAEDRLEEHVMTWLIEGFRGKFIVFDPANRVKDSEVLIERQVVDEYISGPISPVRFLSLIKSNLTRDVRFASPRAMTTFDLFRNLFDRCLNSIFFFGEDLDRCVAANLRAERMTGYTLYELRQRGLKDLCAKDHFDPTLRIIRRANRQYYDSKGHTVLMDRFQQKKEVAFSCGVFNFGRKSFVKMELQDLPAKAEVAPSPTLVISPPPSSKAKKALGEFNTDNFFKAFDQGLSQAAKNQDVLSVVTCRVKPLDGPPQKANEENALLDQVMKSLQKSIRQTDIVARISHYQFVVLLPRTSKEKAEKLVLRLISQLSTFPAFKSETYDFDIEAGYCPPEAYPFMNLLRQAGGATPESRIPH